MKQLTILLIIAMFGSSCSKEVSVEIKKEIFKPQPVLHIPQPAPVPVPDSIMWCPDDKIEATGDSYTAAPGAISYAWYLADYLGIDTMIYDGVSRTFPQAAGWKLEHGTDKVLVNGYSGWESWKIEPTYNPDTSRAQIICIGSNNSFEHDVIIRDLKRSIAKIKHNRYVIIVTMWGNRKDRRKGTQYYDNSITINALIEKEFPGHVYNPMPDFVAAATNSPEDQQAIIDGVIPPSLVLDDDIHLNGRGEQTLGVGLAKKMLRTCKN